MAPDATSETSYDAVVIGSGFGGTMFAYPLVHAGLRVLLLERGDWIPRGSHNWAPDGTLEFTPFFSSEHSYRVEAGGRRKSVGACSCVGGASVFYGGVTLRLREVDFAADPDIVGDSGARWPITYRDLEPFYTRAEQILDVAGESGADPTEPYRSAPYPQPPAVLAPVSRRVARAAGALGLRPARLPLALNHRAAPPRSSCIACLTCDTYACAIGAKNDLATQVIPDLVSSGLELRTNTVAVRFLREGRRVVAVECYDKTLGRYLRYRAQLFAVAAGALASPHLLLASGLDRVNPAGHTVGRYLLRHCSAIVYGLLPRRPDGNGTFHKQLGIYDFYFGHPAIARPRGKLGVIQQIHPPPSAFVREVRPALVGRLLGAILSHLVGLIVIAEDQPRYANHVAVDPAERDRFGLPRLVITHRYSKRDRLARGALLAQTRRILRRAGALLFYEHDIKTFSHALGTVRMGADPGTSALDAQCRFRGIDNLYVVDASCLPTAGAVNPSLTVSANALRVGESVARGFRKGA